MRMVEDNPSLISDIEDGFITHYPKLKILGYHQLRNLGTVLLSYSPTTFSSGILHCINEELYGDEYFKAM